MKTIENMILDITAKFVSVLSSKKLLE